MSTQIMTLLNNDVFLFSILILVPIFLGLLYCWFDEKPINRNVFLVLAFVLFELLTANGVNYDGSVNVVYDILGFIVTMIAFLGLGIGFVADDNTDTINERLREIENMLEEIKKGEE